VVRLHASALAVCVTTLAALAGCAPIAVPRFPPGVSAAFADAPTRRLETDDLVLYYPAARADQARRFAAHAGGCLRSLKAAAVVKNRHWARKPVVAMPEVELNNAYVAPPVQGLESIAVVPTANTFDFATEFGLPPDPRFVGCHELVHHVHENQIDGTWATASLLFGEIITPQLGFDPWFFEGVAAHYEAALQPGVGRPRWPIFTGVFAAGFAGRDVSGGDLSELSRDVPLGSHYLVGAMFVDYLVETYGERALWLVIGRQASSSLVTLGVAGRFEDVYGKDLGGLLAGFTRWAHARFPVRAPPATQTAVTRELGTNARYARGADGTEAWIAADRARPAHLVVRAPDGRELADVGLTDLVPPRTLALADPAAVSGLSITADGREVWFTMVDLDGASSTTRLLRWRAGDGVEELATGLGPGASISPDGATYYYVDVDGDRWRLARWSVSARARAGLVHDVAPGEYVLAAQVSADGTRVVESVWDGARFALWIVDAATGRRREAIADAAGGPMYDGAFLADGRVMYLAVTDGRFQVRVRHDDGSEVIATDAPYAVLAPRGGPDGTIRFLDREGWQWDLAQVAAPAQTAAAKADGLATVPLPLPAPAPALPTPPLAIRSDRPYSVFDRFFVPTLRAPTLVAFGPGIPLLGVVLAGGDRLGFQRWAGAGYVQFGIEGQPTVYSGAVSYVNAMLAPWLVLADASRFRWNQREEDLDPDTENVFVYRARRTRDVNVALVRVWRESIAVALGATYAADHDRFDQEPAVDATLGGVTLGAAYAASAPTLDTGEGRALGTSATVGFYPSELSSFAGDVYDLRATVRGALPARVGATLVGAAEVRGRALVGRDQDPDLLEVGGVYATTPLYAAASVDVPEPVDDLRFPPDRKFAEAVRGFEDLPIATDRAVITHVSARLPIIVDRGVTNTWFLPASYVRQIDVELFAAAWYDLDPDHARARHEAVGGALTLRLALFRLPLAIQYQLARRVSDDEAFVHVFGFAPDL
jgi:hypothetical protein